MLVFQACVVDKISQTIVDGILRAFGWFAGILIFKHCPHHKRATIVLQGFQRLA